MTGYTQEELEQAISRCEAEPVHQLGQIQPYGMLLVLSHDSSRTVLQASSNVEAFLGVTQPSVLGSSLSAVLDSDAAESVEKMIVELADSPVVTATLKVARLPESSLFQARLFASGTLFVLELEPDEAMAGGDNLLALLPSLQRVLLQHEIAADPAHYFQAVAVMVREQTGFDRVMVYRFDANWDGEVIAESRVEALPSYCGQRFPASDIPPQARRLYTRNLVRLVADVDAPPVPVLPTLNPATFQVLDLTHASLRSLSPVHIEYLRNMGVQASMSISLLQNGRLWGLIACHHRSAKRVAMPVQELAAFISRMLSSRLSSMESLEQHNLEKKALFVVGELLKNISKNSELLIFQPLLPELLTLFNASGVILVVEGKCHLHGVVPGAEAITDLLVWLGSQPAAEMFCCDQLEQHFPPASAYADIVAGLLAIPLSREMRNCIIWLRKEKLRTVHWAGRPDKILDEDMAGVRLSPRKSFELWAETWRGRSEPWSPVETATACVLALALTEGLAQKRQLELSSSNLLFAEERLRLMLETLSDGVFGVSCEGKITFVNFAACKILGYSSTQLIGRDCHSTIQHSREDGTVYPVAESSIYAACTTGKEARLDTEVFWHSDGHAIAVQYTAASIAKQGEIIGAVISFSDITDRKLVEVRLRASEQRAQLLLDAAPDCIVISDDQRNIIMVNRKAEQMFGYGRAELIGQKVEMLMPERFRQGHVGKAGSHMEKGRAGGKSGLELLGITKSGREFSIEISLVPIQIDGKIVMSSGIRDISERKQAEMDLRLAKESAELSLQQLNESTRHLGVLSRAIEQSPTVHIITDVRGVIQYVNPKFYELTGYRADEVLGKTPNILNSGTHPKAFYAELWGTIASGREWRGEMCNKKKDGSLYWEYTCISPVLNEAGEITQFVATKEDITEKKATAWLLLSARDDADAANRAKGEFLANMSHEIRTPLNAIIGMAYLAMKTEIDDKARDYLGKIHFSGKHLLKIVNDILDMSKIEAGRFEIEKVAFRTERLLANVASMIKDSAAEKDLALELIHDPSIPILLEGDFLRLSQVLVNYISNAIKFTERGKIVIRFARLDETDSEIVLRFSVADTGIGLTPAQVESLFQPFQQADASISRKFGGTGLGLSICKQLAELMGGEVGVDSEPGKGSTFWFTARLGKVQESVSVTRAQTSFGLQMAGIESLRGASILLAEDNVFNQEVAVEMLEQAGAWVMVANNGREALACLSQARFDCVLMDMQMPEMDGLEATRRIRANPALAGLKIIALTANIMQGDRDRCFAAGMDEFINKPFLPEHFYSTIAQLISERPRVTSAAEVVVETVPEAVRTNASLDDVCRNPAIIDLSVLVKMLGDIPEKLQRFSFRFIESAQSGLLDIEVALAAGDVGRLGAIGHRIKSSASSVGAMKFAELCFALELAGKDGDMGKVREIVPQLRPLLSQIEAEIKQKFS